MERDWKDIVALIVILIAMVILGCVETVWKNPPPQTNIEKRF